MNENKIYQAYYTKSEPIINYMVDLLDLRDGGTLLEPCAGDGVFIDRIINEFNSIKIDALELNDTSFNLLVKKYSDNTNISLKKTDTLTDIDLELLKIL